MRNNQRQPFKPFTTEPHSDVEPDPSRRDAPVAGLDPAQTCTSLPDAYRRIYHGACGACWTHRKLPTLNGHRRDARGAYLQHTKVPRDTLFPGGDQNLDSSLPYFIVQSPLYFNGYCISTAMSTRLKDTHSIWILNTPVAKCFQTSFRLVARARFFFLSRFLPCVPLRRLAFD